ncbi:MAG: biosynthetic-type acetolactate synthase large subunit [Anaerolineaceae bacterium]|jgi:acetolactate synthase-1/2/3 large subunit|nr:biosynthetic-type acetolactate synthase large subunit [Anaerolineaceae bacterium]
MKKSGAQILWECIVQEGVDTVFGFPGGATLPIYDILADYPVHHVLVRHEQGAAHMADGYARATGKVGVALATSGPGATNLVTGIATAFMDSIPMVCITGQVPSWYIGYDAFQETDVTGVTLPITKHNYLVTSVEEISATIREAFYLARSGRPGPVLIDITKDAQMNEIDWEYDDTPIKMSSYRRDFSPTEESLKQAAEMIAQAKRPVILAGAGVLQSGAMKELLDFAEKTQTPITTTLLGLGGVPASHPLSLGMMGMHGVSWANQAIQEADLLLAMGMRFDDRVTGNMKTYAPNARKIHFEIDPSEINKNVKVDIALIGDLKNTLAKLHPYLSPADHAPWVEKINNGRAESAQRDILNWPDTGKLHAAHVLHDLWEYTEGKGILVTDVGQHQMWAAQYYKHEKPNTLITSGGLGTMGFALPAAIGAKTGCPDAEVWVIAGDGGFQMTQAELSTAAQEGLKINIAIINNGYLGMVRQWQDLFYGKRYAATPMHGPDFIKIAEAHGLTGIRVTKRSEIKEAIRKAQADPGTVILEFRVVEEDNVYPMVSAGADLHEMLRRPLPDQS